ncbi:hypothetical protein TNCV_3182641 [Trichonephila clavipes]|uniref:Uncharacterized protein n=1 Tax=Trichonephila clavipes TaxID=2585209 RepID=A0A8X6VAT6_TRICX|nr:hypothetical protein TNCV_3182641 [Trichonephila clavipes]
MFIESVYNFKISTGEPPMLGRIPGQRPFGKVRPKPTRRPRFTMIPIGYKPRPKKYPKVFPPERPKKIKVTGK